MADTYTTNYGWVRPEIGASRDTWGTKANANFQAQDLALFAVSNVANAALPMAGGTVTGNLSISGTTNAVALNLTGGLSGTTLTLSGAASITGALTLSTATASGLVTVGSLSAGTLTSGTTALGNTAVAGTLGVTGNSTILGTVTAGGLSTVSGSLSGNLSVTGSTTTGTLISGSSALGNTSVTGTLTTSSNLYTRDLTVSRGDGTGVVHLNAANTRYLYFDGSYYNLPGSGLYVNGSAVYTTANFDPNTKLNVSGGTISGNLNVSGGIGNIGNTYYFGGVGSGLFLNWDGSNYNLGSRGTVYHTGNLTSGTVTGLLGFTPLPNTGGHVYGNLDTSGSGNVATDSGFYFGGFGSGRYLNWDGSNYNFGGSGIAWHTGNLNGGTCYNLINASGLMSSGAYANIIALRDSVGRAAFVDASNTGSGYALVTGDGRLGRFNIGSGYIECLIDGSAFAISVSPSDRQYKENIVPTTYDALSKVKQIEFKAFDWKPNFFISGHESLGIVAQDIESFAPDLIRTASDGNKSPNTDKLVMVSLKAIQELEARVSTLEAR